jgi:hypothetical protein
LKQEELERLEKLRKERAEKRKRIYNEFINFFDFKKMNILTETDLLAEKWEQREFFKGRGYSDEEIFNFLYDEKKE